jgi:NAD-dependent dihydropyrimidine dehydrogenase PreA subunit
MVTQDWMPQINQTRCDGCGVCIDECPTGALGWHNNKATLAYPEKCIYCATCETICPQNAIELPYLILRKPEEDVK